MASSPEMIDQPSQATPVSLLARLRVTQGFEDWARFVKLFTPVIFRIGKRAGLSADDAIDLTQDVFVVLARTLPNFEYDSSKSFRGWLYTITRNKLRENARGKRLPTCHLSEEMMSILGDDSEEFMGLEAREYRQMIVARALRLMKQQFSSTTWKACWEHLVSGRTAADVGEELGISPGAVYVAKSRVLKRLRDELEGIWE